VKGVIVKRLLFLVLLSGLVNAGCLNDTIFSYSGTGTAGFTMVDFTGLNEYVDADLTKVYVTTGQDNYKYDDHRLTIDTPEGSTDFTVLIKDQTFSQAKSIDATIPDEIITLSKTDLTQPGGFYNMTYRYENTDQDLINYGNFTTLNLEILCDSYSPETINLLDYNQTSLSRATKETPIRFRLNFKNDTGELMQREYKITDTEKHFNYFIPQAPDGEIISINYELKDYTGQYGQATAHIQRSLSGDNYQDVEARQFDDNGEIYGVYIFKDVYYKISLTSGTATNDKGLFLYTENGTQEIRVTYPALSFGEDTSDGVSLRTWNNITTGRVYCYWYVENTEDFSQASINVYNKTLNTYTSVYSTADSSNPTGEFSYLVPNTNLTYKTSCKLKTTDREFERVGIYSFYNTSIKFLNPPFTNDTLGFSVTELFSGFALFFIIFLIGLSSQINGSYIAVFVGGALWLFNYFGWVVVDSIILGFIMVLAVLYRLRQSRVGAG